MRRTEHYHDPNAPRATTLVPATSAVIFDAEGRVLLHRRADNGLWSRPGGAMEIGETVKQCVVREVLEETGLDVRPTALVGIYSDPRHVIEYEDGEVRHPEPRPPRGRARRVHRPLQQTPAPPISRSATSRGPSTKAPTRTDRSIDSQGQTRRAGPRIRDSRLGLERCLGLSQDLALALARRRHVSRAPGQLTNRLPEGLFLLVSQALDLHLTRTRERLLPLKQLLP